MKEPVQLPICPYCSREMEAGHVFGFVGNPLYWWPGEYFLTPPPLQRTRKKWKEYLAFMGGFFLDDWDGIWGKVTRRNTCYACRNCRVLITPLEDMPPKEEHT